MDPLGFIEITDRQDLITSLIETLSTFKDEVNVASVCNAFVISTNRTAMVDGDKPSLDEEEIERRSLTATLTSRSEEVRYR